ncbi:hypothetical protein C2G38_2196322 [Gigaspora rosea]|uniref:Uncharacterized protein n=1 Tax=Gigaspora rosea TaxID=44941 RepID=A0A397UWK0_9GLOM|nr:hypothetical protein C2G38_2196322 [Gigaspora rosea]
MSSSVIKMEEISDIANAHILDHNMAEVFENKPKKTLEEMQSLDWHHIVECYEILSETLTKDFISKYGNYYHIKEDKLIVATRAKEHRICLELLKTCMPVRDVDDKARYKADDIKTHLNSPELASYLQDLVPKMNKKTKDTSSSNVNTMPTAEDIQDLFNIT